MGSIKWIFVLYSICAILSMGFIGIAIALRNLPLIFLGIIVLCVIMAFGFKTKKKMREQGLL